MATILLLEKQQDAAMIESCSRVLYQVLVRCRHKGAIEAAGESIGLLCRRLFVRENNISVRAIPRKLLSNILGWVEDLEVGSSVTRRSAGLVFLVVKIVGSQPDKSGPVIIFNNSNIFLVSFINSILFLGFPARNGYWETDYCGPTASTSGLTRQ